LKSRGRVLVIGTGGTIGSSQAEYLNPGAGVRAVLELAPVEGVDFQLEELMSMPSSGLGLDEMARLLARVVEADEEGFTGVVITHGTDTLPETAFALALTINTSMPVVLTGAMRGPGQPGSDAARNLRDAVSAAASDVVRDCGVIVVFDGSIFAGMTVEKTSSNSSAAIRAAAGGVLGHVVEGEVRLISSPRRARSLELHPSRHRPVALLGALPGDDGTSLRAAARCVDGVVIAGFGGGHLPPQMMPAVRDVASSIAVVVTTAAPGAPAFRATYGHAGSEQDLAAAGAVVADALSPRKAALMLSMCLASAAGPGELRTFFDNIYD
jgi:L-asparaginase